MAFFGEISKRFLFSSQTPESFTDLVTIMQVYGHIVGFNDEHFYSLWNSKKWVPLIIESCKSRDQPDGSKGDKDLFACLGVLLKLQDLQITKSNSFVTYIPMQTINDFQAYILNNVFNQKTPNQLFLLTEVILSPGVRVDLVRNGSACKKQLLKWINLYLDHKDYLAIYLVLAPKELPQDLESLLKEKTGHQSIGFNSLGRTSLAFSRIFGCLLCSSETMDLEVIHSALKL